MLDPEKKEGNLVKILPRKNSLIRPAVANVDQAFVIFAMDNPKPKFYLSGPFSDHDGTGRGSGSHLL